MLVHAEKIVARYLMKEMCDDRPPPGRFDLFAVEGGTAGMCYTFRSLVANRFLRKGDTIALGTPIFTPYLEIPELEDFSFHTVEARQTEMVEGRHSWQ
jgi:aspartate 4-decarboxylase